ncbi:MAG: family 2 glycosyl transferase [Rhodobacteraceae bacterium]|nr:family 2 glycosyl transferase [Paracoccaceae bacterium]
MTLLAPHPHTTALVSDRARIAVIIASKGRSAILASMIPYLNRQTLKPVALIIAVTDPADADFDLAALLHPEIDGRILISAPGSCAQRNAALRALPEGIDLVVCYDDDFFPSRTALEGLAHTFASHADVDGVTGRLIADGIGGVGITPDAAESLLRAWDAAHPFDLGSAPVITRDTAGLYGCNMAFRRRAIEGIEFDERLPLYGWQEDVDFASQLAGRRIETPVFTGVHLGTKTGREANGTRLGYSQIVNPHYLWRKGSVSAWDAMELALRNMAANHAKALWPEPWIDRAGRMRGNWKGLVDILTGQADPERIRQW